MNRKNKHVILIAGFRRGGTNILWNILQSHPNVCSPVYETGQVFNKSLNLKLIKSFPGWFSGEKSHSTIDYELFNLKLKTLDHKDNKYKGPDIVYTKKEVEDAWLCLKSVDEDIHLTDKLLEVYPDLSLILLTRNGYALAESFSRRGKDIDDSARHYKEMAGLFDQYSEKTKKSKMIKFEDVIENPFKVANELFEFLDIKPTELELLRFKSKKIVNTKGEHNVTFGKENKKYWVSDQEVKDFIDPDVNKNQLKYINSDQISIFNNLSGEALSSFGYRVL